MYWANFFHIYQPPNWSPRIIKKVANESYRPIIDILKRHPKVKITLNISASLTEQLHELGLKDIIQNFSKLAKKKQIEFTGTAIYHPILPLMPTMEIIRQIKLNTKTNQKYLGKVYNPQGFFSPEMAYGRKVATAIESLGYKWILADEICYNGKLDSAKLNAAYQIKGIKLNIIFRNRYISDYFSFHSNPNNLQYFWEEVKQENRFKPALITGMDGENLGHHRKGWDIFWENLVTDKKVTTLTLSELLKKYKTKKIISPRRGSWSSQTREISNGAPYILWDDPQNKIHQYQWHLIRHLAELVEKNKQHTNYKIARGLLDKRVASDQFWWASAKPWWSLSIIKKKTKELVEISDKISTNEKLTKKLSHQIIQEATSWQTENKFKNIADRYLQTNEDKNGGVRFIGGKKITS
ncbi:MAG: hypothetical protein Q8P20_09210 [bacterium]|nr:hypothetical protein [bacterium]